VEHAEFGFDEGSVDNRINNHSIGASIAGFTQDNGPVHATINASGSSNGMLTTQKQLAIVSPVTRVKIVEGCGNTVVPEDIAQWLQLSRVARAALGETSGSAAGAFSSVELVVDARKHLIERVHRSDFISFCEKCLLGFNSMVSNAVLDPTSEYFLAYGCALVVLRSAAEICSIVINGTGSGNIQELEEVVGIVFGITSVSQSETTSSASNVDERGDVRRWCKAVVVSCCHLCRLVGVLIASGEAALERYMMSRSPSEHVANSAPYNGHVPSSVVVSALCHCAVSVGALLCLPTDEELAASCGTVASTWTTDGGGSSVSTKWSLLALLLSILQRGREVHSMSKSPQNQPSADFTRSYPQSPRSSSGDATMPCASAGEQIQLHSIYALRFALQRSAGPSQLLKMMFAQQVHVALADCFLDIRGEKKGEWNKLDLSSYSSEAVPVHIASTNALMLMLHGDDRSSTQSYPDKIERPESLWNLNDRVMSRGYWDPAGLFEDSPFPLECVRFRRRNSDSSSRDDSPSYAVVTNNSGRVLDQDSAAALVALRRRAVGALCVHLTLLIGNTDEGRVIEEEVFQQESFGSRCRLDSVLALLLHLEGSMSASPAFPSHIRLPSSCVGISAVEFAAALSAEQARLWVFRLVTHLCVGGHRSFSRLIATCKRGAVISFLLKEIRLFSSDKSTPLVLLNTEAIHRTSLCLVMLARLAADALLTGAHLLAATRLAVQLISLSGGTNNNNAESDRGRSSSLDLRIMASSAGLLAVIGASIWGSNNLGWSLPWVPDVCVVTEQSADIHETICLLESFFDSAALHGTVAKSLESLQLVDPAQCLSSFHKIAPMESTFAKKRVVSNHSAYFWILGREMGVRHSGYLDAIFSLLAVAAHGCIVDFGDERRNGNNVGSHKRVDARLTLLKKLPWKNSVIAATAAQILAGVLFCFVL
jgi:hypothetical protein